MTQTEKWQKFKCEARNAELAISANSIRAKMVQIALDFARENRIELPFDLSINSRQNFEEKALKRLSKIIQGVEEEKLGLRFRQDGDIDILAPPDWTDDQVADYTQFGWIIIIAGILVVAAVIGHSLWLYREAEEIRNKYNELLKVADNKFCADPTSPLCTRWLNKKKIENFEPRKNTISLLEDGIKKFAGGAGNAIKWGLIVAIPLIALSWFGKKK